MLSVSLSFYLISVFFSLSPKAYISNLAQSIRMAATEIALGIVHRRTESMNHMITMDETYGTPPKHSNLRGSFR